MASQMSLIPVSQTEFTHASYRLEQLLQQVDNENESWAEASDGHKETLAVYKKAIGEQRAIIRRAQLEHDEGVTSAQMDVLLAQTKETEEG